MTKPTREELERRLDESFAPPKDRGTLSLIVIRPETDAREILGSCRLSLEGGADGDNWAKGCWKSLPDGRPHPDVQIAITNSAFMGLIEPDETRHALAGDTLHVDLDLSEGNLSPGDRLLIGDRVELEITEVPHTGCGKYRERFGKGALELVNSETGMRKRLRGIYARVARDGVVNEGDQIVVHRFDSK